MEYAKVAINLPAKNIFRQFTYHVPQALDFLGQGWRVVVPFGQQLLEGFIVEEDRSPDLSRELKDIADVMGTEPWSTVKCWPPPTGCPSTTCAPWRKPAAVHPGPEKPGGSGEIRPSA